jgi:hypothetical protein
VAPLPALPPFPGSEDKANTSPADRQDSVNSEPCFYLPLWLGHSDQVLEASQAGLLSGTVCLWGSGCPAGERDLRAWSGGREQASAPAQGASLGAKGQEGALESP